MGEVPSQSVWYLIVKRLYSKKFTSLATDRFLYFLSCFRDLFKFVILLFFRWGVVNVPNRTIAEGSCHYSPCVGPSLTKSPSPLLNSLCPLRNYCGITSKWSLSGHLAPSSIYIRNAWKYVSERKIGFAHPYNTRKLIIC